MPTKTKPQKLWETSSKTRDPFADHFIEDYCVGNDPALDAGLLAYEVYGSIAHAAGLCRIKVLTKSEFKAIQKALKDLLNRSEDFTISREQEDIHTAVEHYLTEVLGETGRKIHTGRSRNDQVQAVLRLFIKDRLLQLHGLACEAAKAWAGFGEKWDKTPLPGYTHLRRAMPTTVGHWAASHAEALLEDSRGLKHAFEESDASPLGSAAGYGVPLPLDRGYVANLMGFSRVQRNTLRVQTSRPRIEAVAISALAILARDLGVMADDVCLYTTEEFGFLKIADAFTTGSSIMPQKKNPDVVELTRGRACLFPGWLTQVLAIGGLPSGYHRDYQLTKGPLLESMATARELLEFSRRLPAALSVNEERCGLAVTEDMMATHKALTMVKKGIPFREAYRRVAVEARKGNGSASAKKTELPTYLGSPGNPGWEELAADRLAVAAWSSAEHDRLYAAWKALLNLEL